MMKSNTLQFGFQAILASQLMLPLPSHALNLTDTPLFLADSVKPIVMLDMSKDHQLWKKAYNDYSDLNGDGQLEITYEHTIDYYGYFDPRKCYTYSSGNSRFEPASVSSTKYCSGQWSGNFLNWAAMSRMDTVSKLLYGGKRSTDTGTDTVLERAYIPPDAHAWSKYYDRSDLAQLTPFTPTTTSTTSSTSRTITNSGSDSVDYTFSVASISGFSNGNYVLADAGGGNFLKGQIYQAPASGEIRIRVANANYAGSGTHSSWTLSNLSTRGLTVCNVTTGTDGTYSQTNTNAPQIYFAAGNHSLWNANEGVQCLWGTGSNANDFAHSGIPASSNSPTLTTHGTGVGLGSYVARVQVCVPSLIGGEKCKQYPDGNYKPIGLLQVYGDPDQIHFGLMTGSYRRNISGGVLRKNIGTFTDEVNVNTNGTFTSTIGIAKTLDRLRLYGFNYNNGYDPSGTAPDNVNNCSFRVTTLAESANSCTSSWGNPMAELYYESLRYFANDGTYSPLYNYTNTGSKDATLNLPQPAWTQPVTQTNYCAPLNTLVFNTSVSTDDRDLKDTAMTSIGSASTAGALTDAVGSGEGISGNYFIGANGTTNTGRCDAKSVSGLGSLYGICPEGPTLEGSYLIGGIAHHARTHKIRSDLTVPASDTKSLKVATYGIQLATNVPRIAIALSGETTPRVILQPAYWMYDNAQSGGGALVDMKIVSQIVTSTTASGTLYANYETSEAGADHDQDAWGIIRYCLTTVANGCGAGTAANTIRVTTDIISESAGSQQGFGYTISGTTMDGAHFHSGTDGFNYTDPTGVLGCTGCVVGNPATTVTYTLGTTTAGILKDPLYYAAKWGGFNDLNGDGVPSSAAEWDVLTTTGTPGSDGIPDNYFLVNNPLGLETALNAAFLKILRDASASAVATNSTKLNTGSRIYQGRFSSAFWSGQLLSYRLDGTTGSLISAALPPPAWEASDTPYPEWDAGQNIRSQATTNADTRLILTRGEDGTGVDFQFANLSSSQQAYLNKDRLLQQDNCGPERVAFLRGHSENEGSGALTCNTDPVAATPPITPNKFREREISILGDVINSNPTFVGPPAAGYSDVDHPGYSAFRTSYKDRLPIVYVGANDGMLHGFDASVDSATNLPTSNAGKEVIAYVPSPVYENLTLLTDSNYKSTHKYFVDSSPMVADACVSTASSCSSAWKTVLVSGLGAGGRGYFALNVTNPKDNAKHSEATPVFSVSNAEDIVMWEFTNADDADLGFTLNNALVNPNNGQARQIAKFQNDRWGVAVGNGYQRGASGKAVLYVLFLSGPTGTGGVWQGAGVDYMKIEADVGPNNGLTTPTLYDADGDKKIDTVYAGDLQGNVWKFNLSDSNPANWTKALSGLPLFTATDANGDRQPITTPVTISRHPTNGLMVLFGTGKYLEDTDLTATTQTMYGLHDVNAVISDKGLLTPQGFSAGTITVEGETYRSSSVGCDADALTALPDCPASPKGWYANFPITNERNTGAPIIKSGVALFTSFIPSTTPCDFGGNSWLYALNYETGEVLPFSVFDTDTPGVVAILTPPTLTPPTILIPPIITDYEGTLKVYSADLLGNINVKDLQAPPDSRGRITWREIIQ